MKSDVQRPVPSAFQMMNPTVAYCHTCLRRCYAKDCLCCEGGVPKDGGKHVTALGEAGLAFHNRLTVGHDVRIVGGAPPAAPRVVAECWTCRTAYYHGQGAGFLATGLIDQCRAAGHDVRPVRGEEGR